MSYLSVKQFFVMKFMEAVKSTNSKLLKQIINAGAKQQISCTSLYLLETRSLSFFELFFTSSEDRGTSTQLHTQMWRSTASRVWIRSHVKLWIFPGNLSHSLCASCSLPVNTPPVAKGTGKPISIS